MKRKQVEQDDASRHDNEPSAKKPRSGTKASSKTVEDDQPWKNGTPPVNTNNLGRERLLVE
jgi:hypothetical protein